MTAIVIDRRFCGPPASGNGGYVCGCLAAHIEGPAEVTLLAPPPLALSLDIVSGGDGVELRHGTTAIARARSVAVDRPEVPVVDFNAAQEAARRSPADDHDHPLPTCFVCGPARADGDGLRIKPVPLLSQVGGKTGTFVAPWSPHASLAGADGTIAVPFVWAALDCPTAFAGLGARHLGMSGTEAVLLGRMSARIEGRPRAGDRCVIVSWPIGRDGRKLFAGSALLSAEGAVLAAAQATWILVDRATQLGRR